LALGWTEDKVGVEVCTTDPSHFHESIASAAGVRAFPLGLAEYACGGMVRTSGEMLNW
jgi:hypothetical protein